MPETVASLLARQTRVIMSPAGSQKRITVHTVLSDTEMIALLRTRTGGFERSLISNYDAGRWTPGRNVWGHKIVMDALRPPAPAEPVQIGTMSAIIDLFNYAKGQGLKNPKVRLNMSDPDGGVVDPGKAVCLSMAGSKSRTPGAIFVTDGGRWGQNKFYGRIDQNGSYHIRDIAPAGIVDFLREFAGDPTGVVVRYGRMTGNCSLCMASLKDERSTHVGYGRKCAQNWGRPYPTFTEVKSAVRAFRPFYEEQAAQAAAGDLS